jgi:hypothetical protein
LGFFIKIFLHPSQQKKKTFPLCSWDNARSCFSSIPQTGSTGNAQQYKKDLYILSQIIREDTTHNDIAKGIDMPIINALHPANERMDAVGFNVNAF